MSRNDKFKMALLLVASIASAVARPQPAGVGEAPTSGYSDNTASIDLPFLQFTNGGIRVNFAGYHAAAGLGGLLGGPEAKGGLYASAGTPWGPSASAGLGGALGGADGYARGGLHARAGLGNGGPEAAAGLGGSLDGSARSGSRARGGLYAAASPGGPQRGVQNIQPIALPAAREERLNSSEYGAKEPATSLEFKLAAPSSGLVAGEPGDSGAKGSADNSNALVTATDVHDVAEIAYPGRRYYRKLLRGRPVRRQPLYKYTGANAEPIGGRPIGSSARSRTDGIAAPQVNGNETSLPVEEQPYGVAATRKGATLFDDIFNIPISTLAAVNQLLNNKAG